MPKPSLKLAAAVAVASVCLAVPPAHAVGKFRVSSVDCETFFLWKRIPILHYDIVDERKPDYQTNPPADYFREAAERTAEFCTRTSIKAQEPLGPPRRIRGIFFESNDGDFRALYDLDRGGIDLSANIINRIGDRFAVEQRAAAQHKAQIDEIATRAARAEEMKAAEQKAQADKVAAENAREKQFFDRRDLQVARLGTEVTPASFALVEDVRTNPFHFRKLGLAVVRTQFNRMVSDRIAMFGNDLAPLFVRTGDVDRFTRSGETVMLAFRVIERGDVERSYGSLPDAILSAMRAEPIYGDYVGAYTCPGNDCDRIFDASAPT